MSETASTDSGSTDSGSTDSKMLTRLATVLSTHVGVSCERNAALGALSTYRVGGSAALLAQANSIEGLEAIGRAVGAELDQGRTLDLLVVGRGSNLLVADSGWPGLVVGLTGALSDVEIDNDTAELTAGGAALLPVVARLSVAAGLTGFEWAVGVPGSIGGAVMMNAGGHGSDMAASLREIRVVDLRDGQTARVPAADLDLQYRHSSLFAAVVVAEATLQLAPVGPDVGLDDSSGGSDGVLREIVAWRREHQPGGSNAGSVFTNPPGDSAGRLVDSAGCRGLRVGTAVVSDKHANFILADTDGRADDVLALMAEVADRVERHHGVRLSAETRCVGFERHQLDSVAAVTAGVRLTGGPS